MTTENKCLVLGSSGETGRKLVTFLIESGKYDKIRLLNRKPIELQNEKIEEKLVDFRDLKDEYFKECKTAFCCLGSSLTKASKVILKFDFKLNVL